MDAADAAAIGGNGRGWYLSLIAPAGAPPDWLFGPAWTFLYVLMGVAAWRVWRLRVTALQVSGGRGSLRALRLWGWQLLATAVWPPLFFGQHALAASILAAVVLLVLVVATARAFWRVGPVAGCLLLPYLAWTCYAAYLTVGVWWLNPVGLNTGAPGAAQPGIVPMLPNRLAAAVLLTMTGLACLAPVARAQGFGGGNGIASGGFSPPVKGGGVVPNTTLPAPPGLPGAVRHGAAAPASKPALDMQPTDALFDAINRGDLGTAQDALGRGADIDGRNILGMTPLELSVDLGRNDITFLLLSMRGASADDRMRSAGRSIASAGIPARGARATLQAAAAQPRRLSTTVRAVRPALPSGGSGLAPASVRYAGADPGTPVPAAGFLGFGP